MHKAAEQVLIYQAPLNRRRLGVLFGGMLTLLGVACLLVLVLLWDTLDRQDAGNVMLVGILGFVLGVSPLVTALRYQLRLMPQSFVLRGAWKTQAMERSDIAGYRMLAEEGGSVMIFISRRGPAHGVAVKLSFKLDDAFLAWMEGIPDLNLADFHTNVAAVETNLQDAGFNGNARSAIALASRRSMWLLNASIAACVWATFASEPRWLVIPLNAILPLLALELYRRQPEIFTLWEPALNAAKSDVSMTLLIPAVSLGLIAMRDQSTMSWPLCAAGAAALALALSALAGTWRKGRKNFALAAGLLTPYAGAVLLLAFGRN